MVELSFLESCSVTVSCSWYVCVIIIAAWKSLLVHKYNTHSPEWLLCSSSGQYIHNLDLNISVT